MKLRRNSAAYWKRAFELATEGGRSISYLGWGDHPRRKHQSADDWRTQVLAKLEEPEATHETQTDRQP